MEVIFGGHVLLSLLIYFLGKGRINRQERFANLCIALFFPVGGYLTVLVLYLFRDRSSKEIEADEEDNAPVTLFGDRVNIDKERDVVPLEEVLLINDTKTKRQQLIETLKKDFSQYVDMLRAAVRDDDVETSHYAASAVSEIKRKLDLKIQQFSVQYEQSKDDLAVCKEYAGVLEEYLESKLLDENSWKKLMFTFIHVLENIVRISPGESGFYKKLINALLTVRETEKAGDYCRAYLENIENEDAYLANLKYYYTIKDKPTFTHLLKRLQKSKIRLSNQGIQVIRFWQGGG